MIQPHVALPLPKAVHINVTWSPGVWGPGMPAGSSHSAHSAAASLFALTLSLQYDLNVQGVQNHMENHKHNQDV